MTSEMDREEHTPSTNEVIHSRASTFVVLETLGSGAFGKVMKCWKLQTNEPVAIKFIRNDSLTTGSSIAEYEVKMLTAIDQQTAEQNNLVRFFEEFYFMDQSCIVFEMLEGSLRDFLYTHKQDFPLKCIRPVATQLLPALEKLKSLRIIHTDIKPQNIMLVNSAESPYKIKLIDFGCAIYTTDVLCSGTLSIETCKYGALEIVLGLPFCSSLDMWSLGCVLAELFLRSPLFPGSCDYDMLTFITNILGFLPTSLLDITRKRDSFFVQESGENQPPVWRLKSIPELSTQIANKLKDSGNNAPVLSCLNDISKINIPALLDDKELAMEMSDREAFISLLQGMLMLRKEDRITPSDALNHPFITREHLQDFMQRDRSYDNVDAMTKQQNAPTKWENSTSVHPSQQIMSGYTPGVDGSDSVNVNAATYPPAVHASTCTPEARSIHGATFPPAARNSHYAMHPPAARDIHSTTFAPASRNIHAYTEFVPYI